MPHLTCRKTALAVETKAVHLPALVVPKFEEDLIAVSQLTAKGNKVLFTKNKYLLLGPSAFLENGVMIWEK